MSKPNTPSKDMTWENFPRDRFAEECFRALSSIKLNCEYLRHLPESGRDQAQNAEALEDIAVSSARLERSLREMMAMLACLQGDFSPAWEEVELCGLLRSLCAAQAQILEGLGVRLELDCGGAEDFYVQADRECLLQICLHLLSNALRACTQGGCVSISLSITPEESCTLCFADDGCGIQQSPDNYSRFLGGSGAGLTLCREYCRLMGWQLELDSPSSGGTRASVQIPSQAELRRNNPEVALCEPDSPWEKMRQESQLRYRLALELHCIPGLETVEFK